MYIRLCLIALILLQTTGCFVSRTSCRIAETGEVTFFADITQTSDQTIYLLDSTYYVHARVVPYRVRTQMMNMYLGFFMFSPDRYTPINPNLYPTEYVWARVSEEYYLLSSTPPPPASDTEAVRSPQRLYQTVQSGPINLERAQKFPILYPPHVHYSYENRHLIQTDETHCFYPEVYQEKSPNENGWLTLAIIDGVIVDAPLTIAGTSILWATGITSLTVMVALTPIFIPYKLIFGDEEQE